MYVTWSGRCDDCTYHPSVREVGHEEAGQAGALACFGGETQELRAVVVVAFLYKMHLVYY